MAFVLPKNPPGVPQTQLKMLTLILKISSTVDSEYLSGLVMDEKIRLLN